MTGSPPLAADDPEVWTFDLDTDGEVDESVLSAGEAARADRFHFDVDRVRFRRRRARLRHLLAGYCRQSPEQLVFGANEFGKPNVAGFEHVHFNSTSSDGAGAVAVCRHQVGVDLEKIDPSPSDLDVARRLFAREELAAQRDPGDFFRCWSRKEAYVKVIGHGLSFPLDSFAIEVGATVRPRLLRSDLRPGDLANMTICDISSPAAGLAGALVVQKAGASVVMRPITRTVGAFR